MKNQIYRAESGSGDTIEFSIYETNELNPTRETRELGINVTIGTADAFFDLEGEALESLIDYLSDARSYIKKFNAESTPKETNHGN